MTGLSDWYWMKSYLSLCQLHLVPQGSIPGPLLFLLFINDMPDCTEHSILSLFADDAKCFRKIINVYDCERLQHYSNSLYK